MAAGHIKSYQQTEQLTHTSLPNHPLSKIIRHTYQLARLWSPLGPTNRPDARPVSIFIFSRPTENFHGLQSVDSLESALYAQVGGGEGKVKQGLSFRVGK